MEIYKSDAYGGLRLRTCVIDCGATKFKVPQHLDSAQNFKLRSLGLIVTITARTQANISF